MSALTTAAEVLALWREAGMGKWFRGGAGTAQHA